MQLSPEMIIAAAVILVTCIATLGGAIAILYRRQVSTDQRCVSDTVRLNKKVDELDRFQRNELVDMREESVALAATSLPLLDRSRRLIERMEAVYPPSKDETPLTPHRAHA